jgi:hypothetical protein
MNPLTSLAVERMKFVTGCAPAALASTAGDGDRVSMKNFGRLTIVVSILNGSTVTGTAITLIQATAVSGGSTKALPFSKMWANIDTGATDTLVETAVVSDTFTTDTTNAKSLMYVIEVKAEDLDADGGYDCVAFDGALAANSVGSVLYILSAPRYTDDQPPAAITN